MSSALTAETLSRQLRDLKSSHDALHQVIAKVGRQRNAEPLGADLVREVAGRLQPFVPSAGFQHRAASNPAMTSAVGWAAELSPSGLPGFVFSLRQRYAFAAILAAASSVSLIGFGQRPIPIAGVPPPAQIVGEGQPIRVIKGALSSATLKPWKFAAIMDWTEELAARSDIEALVRFLLGESVGGGLDAAAFSATAPAGLLAGLTAVAASSETDPLVAILADIEALVAALSSPSADLIFVVNPQKLGTAAVLLGPSFPYRLMGSTSVPADRMVAVDPAGLAAALGEAVVSTSDQATLHEEDTTPLPVVANGPTRSLWQTDSIGARIIAPTSWVARPGSVAFAEPLSW